MKQNITLSADADVISQMRLYAKEHNTTVNQIVREHFEDLIKHKKEQESLARKAWADEFLKFTLEHAGRSEEGWKFDREECHKRGRDLG